MHARAAHKQKKSVALHARDTHRVGSSSGLILNKECRLLRPQKSAFLQMAWAKNTSSSSSSRVRYGIQRRPRRGWTCGITVVLTTLLVAPALVPPRAPATVWLVWVCVIATVIAPIVLCAYAVASFNTTTSTAASSPAGYWGHDDAPWWHGTPGNHDFCEEVRRRTTRSIVHSVTSTPQRSLGTN